MARFLQDQSKVVLLMESGTYSSTSGLGIWPGFVQDHEVDDQEGKMEHRYLGTLTRSLNDIDLGPRDVNGKLTYHPQDMRLVFMAIGSIVDTSGTNMYHNVSQIDTNVRQSAFTSGTLNPPMSFTLEDSKQSPGTGRNFIRTMNGVIPDKTVLKLNQSERALVEMDYIAQTLTYSSGTTTTVTENTTKPYLWNNFTLTMNGSTIQTTKEVNFQINQNTEQPHYLNGSRDISVPFQKNREYKLDVTLDLDGNDASMLYQDLYKGNQTFNTVLDGNADATTGSQHVNFVFSGCRIMHMDAPSKIDGVTESKAELVVQNVTGYEYTGSSTGKFIGKFNPW
jgi:hypothetical protein